MPTVKERLTDWLSRKRAPFSYGVAEPEPEPKPYLANTQKWPARVQEDTKPVWTEYIERITVVTRERKTVYVWGQVEIAVWDAILTADEMAILMKGCSPLFVRPQSLVMYRPTLSAYIEETSCQHVENS